jgi:hypothetical protein
MTAWDRQQSCRGRQKLSAANKTNNECGQTAEALKYSDIAWKLSAYLADEAGGGGTGRMISDAILHCFATLIHSTITRNGLGVPSCPA